MELLLLFRLLANQDFVYPAIVKMEIDDAYQKKDETINPFQTLEFMAWFDKFTIALYKKGN